MPFLDLGLLHQALRDDISAAMERTMASSEFILGSQLTEFERAFAAYCGCDLAVGVGSGTDALHLALVALGIGRGDEVITVPNTFVATVEAIAYTGATPVLVDVDPESYTMDPARFEDAITPRTRAVVAVHLYGQPCDMVAICEISRRHGIRVIEDACQAHGATLNGIRVGAWGDVGAFSFYPTKNLGALGDGGAATTGDAELARAMKALRHHGQFDANVFERVGYNSRLDSLQAAVLGVKLPWLDAANGRRREIAARYREGLGGTEFTFQKQVEGSEPVFHIFAARHPRQKSVQAALSAADIGWGRHIVAPIHRHPGYGELAHDGLSVSESLATELISLPVFPELTASQVDRVIEILGKVEVSV